MSACSKYKYEEVKDDPMKKDWVRHLKTMFDMGLDRFQIFIDSARKRGVEGWISLRMNDDERVAPGCYRFLAESKGPGASARRRKIQQGLEHMVPGVLLVRVQG